MSHIARVKHLLEITKIDVHYANYAHSILVNQYAQFGDEEPHPDDAESFAQWYVEYMISIFATQFSPDDVDELIELADKPIVRRMLTVEIDNSNDIDTFFESAIEKHFAYVSDEQVAVAQSSTGHTLH